MSQTAQGNCIEVQIINYFFLGLIKYFKKNTYLLKKLTI